jgi:hypothetical protein
MNWRLEAPRLFRDSDEQHPGIRPVPGNSSRQRKQICRALSCQVEEVSFLKGMNLPAQSTCMAMGFVF